MGVDEEAAFKMFDICDPREDVGVQTEESCQIQTSPEMFFAEDIDHAVNRLILELMAAHGDLGDAHEPDNEISKYEELDGTANVSRVVSETEEFGDYDLSEGIDSRTGQCEDACDSSDDNSSPDNSDLGFAREVTPAPRRQSPRSRFPQGNPGRPRAGIGHAKAFRASAPKQSAFPDHFGCEEGLCPVCGTGQFPAPTLCHDVPEGHSVSEGAPKHGTGAGEIYALQPV